MNSNNGMYHVSDLCSSCLHYGDCNSTLEKCISDKNFGDYVDMEWYNAEHTGEKKSWWSYPDPYNHPNQRYMKSYTEALARVVSNRTGVTLVSLDGSIVIENENSKKRHEEIMKFLSGYYSFSIRGD